MRRHLPAAARWIVLGPDGCEEHLERGHAERQTERAIAIVREDPIVPGAELHPGSHEHRLVAGPTDLEERLFLLSELDLLVVYLARQEHHTVRGEELVPGQPLVLMSAHLPGGACVGASGKGRPLHDKQIMSLS